MPPHTIDRATPVTPLSAELREATSQAHQRTEERGFIQQLMAGELDLVAYTALAAQHQAIYQSLEALGRRLAEQSGNLDLVRPELLRSPALTADVAALRSRTGADPQILSATRAYTQVMDDPGAGLAVYAANAYTRYLGDLSGGQIIKRMLQRHYGLNEDGLSFYTFAQITKIPPYKKQYRHALDELALDQEQRTQVVREAVRAFDHNAAIFDELACHYAGAAVAG